MMTSVPSLDWEYLRWRAGTLNQPEQVQEIMERLEGLWRRWRSEDEEEPSE